MYVFKAVLVYDAMQGVFKVYLTVIFVLLAVASEMFTPKMKILIFNYINFRLWFIN